MKELVPFDQAVKLTTSLASPLGEEDVQLLDAFGRVLRQDVHSPIDIPPFDRSAMDGYAVKAADVAGASAERPVILRVAEEVPAGTVARLAIEPGTAARIMTGAPLPQGADAVVMQELTRRDGGTVAVLEPVAAGRDVGRAGEDVTEGELVLSAGSTVDAAAAGMIGACGLDRVRVARRPRVEVLSTGSEVVSPGGRLGPGQIFDANGSSLVGLARRAGALAGFRGRAEDRPGELAALLASAGSADAILLSGGVSVGDYDLVRQQLIDGGFEEVYWRVAMKPGKPVFFGARDGQVVFGLPGNPVSCMVCFELLVRPYLDVCLGRRPVGLPRLPARLAAPVHTRPGRRKFLRATLAATGDGLMVTPFPSQKSGVLKSMVRCNSLIDVPGEVADLDSGAAVTVIPLSDGWPTV